MTTERKRREPKSTLCHDLLGHLGLHIGGSLDEVLHHLVTLFLAGSLDLLQLLLGFLVRVVLGLLETARVLRNNVSAKVLCTEVCRRVEYEATLGCRLTSASNFLNSSSFCLRYSSISFWASDLASLIRLVRSVVGNVNYRMIG